MARLMRVPVYERLDVLLGVLASQPSWTAPELARELGVSVRTIRRDLARLAARGVIIESEVGRGGGLRVPPRSGLGRLQLGTMEAVDLVLALAVAEQLRSPLMLSTVGALRRKVATAFPPPERARLTALRRRILLGPTSANVAASWTGPRPQVMRVLQTAFFEQRATTITVRSAPARLVEPHYFALCWPAWYLLAWDCAKEAPRIFRVDAITSAHAEDRTFHLRSVEAMRGRIEDVFTTL